MRLDEASRFLTTHGRLLERRRFGLLTGQPDRAALRTALAAYRNPDGGFGWALEPDLRSPESQPLNAMHAFEVLAEAGGDPELSRGLCDWLGAVSLPDGGLPFVLPMRETAGTAPWFAGADPAESSLHLTAAVLSQALPVAALDPAVAAHPWLAAAVDYCWHRITTQPEPGGTLELRYSLAVLDALCDTRPEALPELRRLAEHLPANGIRPVEGGQADEALYPLDFAPEPHRPLRELLPPNVITRDLDRLAGLQQADGGWLVDFASASPAGALEWRGYATVHAVKTLLANG
ncbi:hypothetical protein N8J89_10035 [Crossiella sp. CA-258035]|uniref:hypothetical protein n=1 Tax=Crossiella sp. CA-258035 TaxID=2981138 RepID=UPI0024BCA517|nr:hypothetical protein [Crossiella sp. CA-258035]WHT21370.1 hypothetical protein N8J89_10035 [Crossiella sp. CA-258035]